MTTASIDPAPLWALLRGVSTYAAVVAGIELGVFDALDGGVRPDAVLASELGADPERLRTLLDVLTAEGYVAGGSDGRSLTAISREHLVAARPGYLGALVRLGPGLAQNVQALAETVRGGQVPEPPGVAFQAELAAATFQVQLQVARRVLQCPALEGLDVGVHLFDIGAGMGPWAIACLESRPSSTATLVDFPAVLEAANRELVRRGVAGRATLVGADLHETGFDEADVVVLGHVCRSQGLHGAARLIARAAGAVRDGGVLVISEYVLDDDRTGPAPALAMAVTMLANHGGRTFTRSEYRRWLAEAGMHVVDESSQGPGHVIIARRQP